MIFFFLRKNSEKMKILSGISLTGMASEWMALFATFGIFIFFRAFPKQHSAQHM